MKCVLRENLSTVKVMNKQKKNNEKINLFHLNDFSAVEIWILKLMKRNVLRVYLKLNSGTKVQKQLLFKKVVRAVCGIYRLAPVFDEGINITDSEKSSLFTGLARSMIGLDVN